MNDYILVAIMMIVSFTSLVVSSRKSGYVIGYKVPFRDKYTIDKNALGAYCKNIVLIAAVCVIVGTFFSQDTLTVFAFTVMNLFFIGYALAWEKVIKLK